jgi:hypothetical protein
MASYCMVLQGFARAYQEIPTREVVQAVTLKEVS